MVRELSGNGQESSVVMVRELSGNGQRAQW